MESDIQTILTQIRHMVNNSDDKRKTALAQLKEEEAQDPFRILIGTILSHRTRDENTTLAARRLFSKYGTPEKLAQADVKEVTALIKPAGFYNVKAKNIIQVARQIVTEFKGVVPDNLQDLLKLKSVGRKTANCVLVYGYNKPAIPVDTHVHRISNRLGLVNTRTPEETEERLVEHIPEKYWININELFVRFGQTICKPAAPRCDICTLTNVCRYYNEVVVKEKLKNKA
ncbi:MAG: endonuclease III [Nitrososphaerota archaeon]